jgi:hypothetical protein
MFMRWLVLRWRLFSLTLVRWVVFKEWLLFMIKWGRRFVFRRRMGLVLGRLMVVS